MCKKLICPISFLLLFGLFTDAANANINSALLAYYRLDGDATDTSGNGNDGTLMGSPQSVPGKFDQALEFEGQDYVLVEGYIPISGAADRAVTAWIKMQTAGVQGIVAWGVVSRQNKWVLRLDDGRLRCEIEGSFVRGDTLLNDGEWHHTGVSFVNDGTPELGDVVLYVDGVLEAHGQSTLEINTSTTGNLEIGRNLKNDGFFQGSIDDVHIYDRALTEDEIQIVMQGSAQRFPLARGANPKDGSILESTWANLSWRAGDYAVSHDVYLGDNFDDVNNGAENTFMGNRAETVLIVGLPGFAYPDGLVPGTTYYWRIDEVNDADPNSPWKGTVWSFSIPSKTAYAPNPADGAESVDIDVTLSWTGGFGSKLHTVYFGDNFDEVTNKAGGLPQGSATYTPGTLQIAKTYYWRVDEFDSIDTFKGDLWSFLTEGAVGSPQPAKGAVDVIQTPVLTWTPGVLGASHDIYFGIGKDAVKNADISSPEYKGTGNLGSEMYDAGNLEWNTAYYWRIDEANNANADSPWTGPLWNFTTANFIIIDDFESYNDLDPDDPDSNRIFNAWIDGYDDPTNGSLVGYDTPPFAEQTIVHGGNQSMPMSYDNAVGKSEATSVLISNRDWTVNGVNRLTIWYRGSSSNSAEQMYIALNGNARVDHDDPGAAQATRWTEWNIDLQGFADQGVNLANVNSITLGLSSVTGGTGVMYFDDIRLYPPEQ
jgi:hypothetical protein